jgi:hypothetical protein
VRLGNGELDAVTELHRVNLSPENRFEASPLRGNSTATGTFRRHLGVLVRNGRDHSMGIVGVVLVGIVWPIVSESSQPRHERRALGGLSSRALPRSIGMQR